MRGSPQSSANGTRTAGSDRRRAMAFLRDVAILARQELDDSIRSRRAVVMLVLYVAGAMLACNVLISALHKAEAQISHALSLKASSSTGAVTKALWESHFLRDMVMSLVGDKQVARDILALPPMAVFYGIMAFFFVTPLILLSSSSRIADEVSTGSARLVLLRTTRPAWCLGKFCGQALLLIVALLLSAAGAWCIARFRLSGMNGWETGGAMLVCAARVWIYGLAVVGLALGVSQMTRSPGLATTLALLAWIVTAVLSGVAGHYAGEGLRRGWEIVLLLVPQSHRLDLCRSDPVRVFAASLFLVSLGLAYLFAGYAVFRRKDL